MSDYLTARFALPTLALAQAQKELTHNEALARIDMLLHAVVEGTASDPSTLTPRAGQCWRVAPEARDLWQGREGQLAGWTDGGWRYAAPVEAMHLFDRSSGGLLIYRDGMWTPAMVIAAPEGGVTQDDQARTAIALILKALQHAGLSREN